MDSDDDGWVDRMTPVASANLWMNAGFFAFRHEIFSYIRDGEEAGCRTVPAAHRGASALIARYDGFWACMDTYKEKQTLDDLYHRGQRAVGRVEQKSNLEAPIRMAYPRQRTARNCPTKSARVDRISPLDRIGKLLRSEYRNAHSQCSSTSTTFGACLRLPRGRHRNRLRRIDAAPVG